MPVRRFYARTCPRRPRHAGLWILAALALLPTTGKADIFVFRGRVVMEDGSPPLRLVGIQRTCQGLEHPLRETNASPKTGEYSVRLEVSDFGGVFSGGIDSYGLLPCVLEAIVDGFSSSQIDLTNRRITMNPRLPDIILTHTLAGSLVDLNTGIPHGASKPWATALKFINAKDWVNAEKPLRVVVEAAPQFAAGWAALGMSCGNQQKLDDARPALEKAVQLDPKRLPPYVLLTDTLIAVHDWEAAAKVSQTLIQADTKHLYIDAFLDNALARYQLKDVDGALASVQEGIRLDKYHDYPRSEYILGLILEAKKDNAGAIEHMRNYIQQHPHAKDVAVVAEHINNVGKEEFVDLVSAMNPADMRMPPAGEAPVPGGIKAFATIARMKGTPSPADFFLEYCRDITDGAAGSQNPTIEARETIRTFMTSVAELEALGERKSDSENTLVRIAVDTDEHRRKATRILELLGWRLLEDGDSLSIEPGDQAVDGQRQRIPGAFGLNELDLRNAIQNKRSVEFEIPKESARLIGGAAWALVLKGAPEITGGPAEVFVRDWRFARLYAGLGSMDPDTAGALVTAVTLPNLLIKYSTLVSDYGDTLTMPDKHLKLPGGSKAAAIWAHLVGSNPQNPAAFLRAILDKDGGRVLSFYADLARANAAHQDYFLATQGRADAFYKWYRDSALRPGANPKDRWQSVILQEIRLDAGKVQFPGGRQAWTSGSEPDDDVLLRLPSMQPLSALVELEAKRGMPLDQGSATLLAQHYDDWRFLFPYFVRLPGLGAPEFQALARFATETAKAAPARQAVLMGDWHSLVELIALGSQAGSLNPAQGAQAFRQACEGLQSDNPSTAAIALLRRLSGEAADADEALATGLLRLSGARRDNFEQVETLQHVPHLASLGAAPDATRTLEALSGAVYAAVLNPQHLLVAEDPRLLVKHNFLPIPGDKRTGLFADSAFVASNAPPGSSFMGGFARFREVAGALDRRTVATGSVNDAVEESPVLASATPPAAPPVSASSEPIPRTGTLFKVSGDLVEVYATITDNRGRYIDDLKATDFSILENGAQRPQFSFENNTSAVTVALLFDTTGSMDATLPSLKNAALKLIQDLRPDDTVGVYAFNDHVTELQPFTKDKSAAEQAVLRAHAAGTTALYDALLRVNHDLSLHSGKKVIIVFTDGDDNASMLPAESAILRAKSRGIPIYTVAEGEALLHSKLIEQLANMSSATGGNSFLIHKLTDIGSIFQKMSEDLMHGYLLTFQPSAATDNAWRKIQVVLAAGRNRLIRAREGYYPEQ